MAKLKGTLSTVNAIDASLSSSGYLNGKVIPSKGTYGYEGPYEITPGAEEQVLPTRGYVLIEDIIVNAVPSTYGRIDWNGQYLTVS